MLNIEKRNWHGIKRILLYPTFNVLLGNEKWQSTVPYATDSIGIAKRSLKGLHLFHKQDFNKFGPLNYSLSLPLSVAYKNWNFLLSYTYNFQQVLPDEPIFVTNSGYLSFSITRYFNFKSNSVLTDLLKIPK